MARRRNPPKILLVEGENEKRIIPYLMGRNGIHCGEQRSNAVVDIEPAGGIENLLNRTFISSKLKSPGLTCLGVLLDADEDSVQRWRQVRRLCLPYFPTLPDALPPEGVSITNAAGLRIGVWIMPDNQSPGKLESLLKQLIPRESQTLFAYAQAVCRNAKVTHKAPYRDVHFDKACLHTWLAWNDQPGTQLHQVIDHGPFNAKLSDAGPFVQWFRNMFDLGA